MPPWIIFRNVDSGITECRNLPIDTCVGIGSSTGKRAANRLAPACNPIRCASAYFHAG